MSIEAGKQEGWRGLQEEGGVKEREDVVEGRERGKGSITSYIKAKIYPSEPGMISLRLVFNSY